MKENGFTNRRAGWIWALVFVVAAGVGCGSSSNKNVVRVDAEYDPATISDTSWPITEATPGVAQSYTVLADGRLDQFWFVITQGESLDDGIIRVTVRPADAFGVPDPDPSSSIIIPIDVNTTVLPPVLVDEFSVFDVSSESSGREVLAGQMFAIVVDFVSRTTNNDTNAIARVLGQTNALGDPYLDGTGSTGESGVGFTANTSDYFFRTFVLQRI